MCPIRPTRRDHITVADRPARCLRTGTRRRAPADRGRNNPGEAEHQTRRSLCCKTVLPKNGEGGRDRLRTPDMNIEEKTTRPYRRVRIVRLKTKDLPE